MKNINRHYLESSSFKMALLFTVLLSVSAAILGYLLNDFGRQDFLHETEAAIDAEIHMLTGLAALHNETLDEYMVARPQQDPIAQFRHETAQGRLIAGTIEPLPSPMDTLTEGVLGFELTIHGQARRFAAKVHTLPDGTRIIVARDIDRLLASYQRLRTLSSVIIAMMLAVVLVSFAISHFVVSRINRISSTAWMIATTGDLSQRISISSQWDDLSSLSQVLNGFLEKIEALMSGIREVSRNIAHDLRTPLMGLRSDIESLKKRSPSEADIDQLLAEADRILAVFQALLRIASIEQGQRQQAFAPVSLWALARDVVELYEPLAEEQHIKLQLRCDTAMRERLGAAAGSASDAHDLDGFCDDFCIAGDANLLFQLLTNVVDNALKFSPSGTQVEIHVGRRDHHCFVSIQDQGPGIAPDEKDKVFRSFYRGDQSRSQPGNGLGLSLAKAIVEQHHGVIGLHDAHPGLRVDIQFQAYEKLRNE